MLLSWEEVIWGYTSMGWVVLTYLPSAHTDTHTNTCLTLCPWLWHLYHQQFSLSPSMWGWSYRYLSIINCTSSNLPYLFTLFTDSVNKCISFSAFHPASLHPAFILPSLHFLIRGDRSHRQGHLEIILHQLVTNRREEIWRLSGLIKSMLRQTRKGDW